MMPNPKLPKIIAVDIDDVLASSAEDFVAYSNKKWGTQLKVEDYTEHWAELWGVDHEEYTKRSQHIYNSNVQKTFKLNEEAKPVLEQLTQKYKLVVITSRHRLIQEDTKEWLATHFEGLFEQVYFAGIWDVGHDTEHALNLTKRQLVKELDVNYLIDDQPKHCFGAVEVGVTALLFGEYPWNSEVQASSGVVRVKNWQAVLEYFNDVTGG